MDDARDHTVRVRTHMRTPNKNQTTFSKPQYPLISLLCASSSFPSTFSVTSVETANASTSAWLMDRHLDP
jgi:hypothetical protein